MATIAELRFDAVETALGETVDRLPELSCELERVVESDLPGVWCSGVDDSDLEAALAADPSVDAFDQLVTDDDRSLYELTFTDEVCALVDLLLVGEATLLSATLTNGQWSIRVRFSNREDIRVAYERLRERDVPVEIGRLSQLTDSSWEQIGLTAQQYESLVAAVTHGYFEIPRRISMQDLSDELDISHQALSERLRRAYGTLATTELGLVSDLEAESETETESEPISPNSEINQ